MTLTLANIPHELDQVLRQRALSEGKSVDEVALNAIRAGLALVVAHKNRDLSEFAGSWIEDAEVNTALKDQDHVDTELWK